MSEITTTDLAKFGIRERDMAEKLLRAWRTQGLPDDFNKDEVTVMFNSSSGYVFLTNSDCQVAMLTDDDKLQSFYSCPECGHQGFKESMEHDGDEECQRYQKEIGL